MNMIKYSAVDGSAAAVSTDNDDDDGSQWL